MNNINKQVQNLTLVDFANMFKMTQGGEFATSVEKTNGRIYADKNGVVHNVDHALSTGKGDAAANRRLREQLIAAFAKGNATARFLATARDMLGLGRPQMAEKPLDRRVVKQLLQNYREGVYGRGSNSFSPIKDSPETVESFKGDLKGDAWQVLEAKPNVVQEFMELREPVFEECITNLLDTDALSKVPTEMKDGPCREILRTCFRQIAESALAENGWVDDYQLIADPAYKALASILGNKDLGFKTLFMATSLPPREATAFLRAVALVPYIDYGLDRCFFAAAPELARLPLSQFTVGNVLRLARPEFDIPEDVMYSGKPPTRKQFETICKPLADLKKTLDDGLMNSEDGKTKNKFAALNMAFYAGASVKDIMACLKDFKSFRPSMMPMVSFQSIYYSQPKNLSGVLHEFVKDMPRCKPEIDVLDKNGLSHCHYNGADFKDEETRLVKEDVLEAFGNHIVELCGEENVIQQQMVLLAMSQNASIPESCMNKIFGDGDQLPSGIQFVLKRDEGTGDVLLSRQTPPDVKYGYSMTLRIRPDGSQSIAYMESSQHAGDVTGLLDEKGHPLGVDTEIRPGEPSTQEEVAKVKTRVVKYHKLLTMFKGLIEKYPAAFSEKAVSAMKKFVSDDNRRLLVQFAKYLDKPGVDAQYVNSQVSRRFKHVFSRMDADELTAFRDFIRGVMGVKKEVFLPGIEYVDTGYETALLRDCPNMFPPQAVVKEGEDPAESTNIDCGKFGIDKFLADLMAPGHLIEKVGLKIPKPRVETDKIEPQVAKQKQEPPKEVKPQDVNQKQEAPKEAQQKAELNLFEIDPSVMRENYNNEVL